MMTEQVTATGVTTVRVMIAQINLRVGDVAGNTAVVGGEMVGAEVAQAGVCVFPELALAGYPPEDLVADHSFVLAQDEALARLAQSAGRCRSVIGHVAATAGSRELDADERRVANAASVIGDGQILGTYHKQLLPNYSVFDEARWFAPGHKAPLVFDAFATDGTTVKVGLAICEDIWRMDVVNQLYRAGVQLVVVPNASPYAGGKPAQRANLVSGVAASLGCPVVYANLVGGQDEVVFDGYSLVADASGKIIAAGKGFEEDIIVVDVEIGQPSILPHVGLPTDEIAELYTALEVGVRDYVQKNHIDKVWVGLSGGIDSALVATIAVDALGPDAVRGILMPSRYSSEGSVTDAEDIANRLGIDYTTVAIADMVVAANTSLGDLFGPEPWGVAGENIQARLRSLVLLGASNKHGGIVLSTGNKSELSIGYCTTGGDLSLGFAPLGDVVKTKVYALANWRNRDTRGPGTAGMCPIPRSSIEKAPSAELAPGQTDEGALGDYETLDRLLERYVEQAASRDELVTEGFDPDYVIEMCRKVDIAEFKRRQCPPVVKVTSRAFGRDRRLPITNGWSPTIHVPAEVLS